MENQSQLCATCSAACPVHTAGRRAEQRCVGPEVERDAVEAGADPDDLSGRAERVEPGGLIARHAAAQHLALPERDRQRQPLERDEGLPQGCPPVDAVPGGEEPSEGRLLGWLHLLAQRSERRAAQAAEHVGITPFALDPTGAELAANQPVGSLEPREEAFGARRLEAVARSRLRGRERAPGAREAGEQDAAALAAEREIGMIAGSRGFGLGLLLGGTGGPGDGTVAVAETRVEGLRDHVVLPVTHTGMLFSRAVARAVCRFLQTGRFGPALP